MLASLAVFLLSVLASGFLTWGIRNFARLYGLAHPPQSARHIHQNPIPRLGGLAIFLTFLTGFLLYSVLAENSWFTAPTNGDVARILMLGTVIFMVGLLDDIVGVSARLKLLVEIGAGLGLYFSGIRFDLGPLHLAGSFTWLICLCATVGWVVLICNGINLIDGLDGLAGGVALFSLVTVFVLAVSTRPGVANAAVILAGSLCGFLVFNFNPASIFMGDSGSLFVGFVLSAFVLSEQPHNGSNFRGLLVALVCFALPLTDVFLSVVRRFLNGHSLFGADREHIHHKLMELGLSHRQVVCILYGISALFAVLSLFLLYPAPAALIPVSGIVLLTILFGIRKLRYYELMEIVRLEERPLKKRKKLANNIAVRKAAAGLRMNCDPEKIFMLLETCLRREFDGFVIVLGEAFAQRYPFPAGWSSRSLQAQWRNSREKLSLTFDLNAADGALLGQLVLHHDACTPILVRVDLIRRVLRKSLSSALRNCELSAPGAPLPRTAFPERCEPASVENAFV